MAVDRPRVRRGASPPLTGLALLALLAAGCGADRPAAGEKGAVPSTGGSPDATSAVATAEWPSGPLPRPTRGYVVISIDTLRADHLGCYGYARPTSPFLDSLAARSTLFEEAYAQFPSTLVSHMTMFTGLQPREHGVFPPESVLAEEVETFPQVFQRAGFRTAGFTEGGYVSGRYGFRRGFDEFLSRDRHGGRQLQQTFRRGVDFLAALQAEQRFLLFLHTYAVHAPYNAPESYQRQFWSGPPPAGAVPPTGPVLSRLNARGEQIPAAAVEHLAAAYDAGIRETDDTLRAFFAELARLHLADDVTVIVTADHGEELQDHGRFHHTQLYREVMRVPLLVVHPDQRQAVRQRTVVQLADLAPTLYALARLQPTGRISGRSLGGLLGREGDALPGTAWVEGEQSDRGLYQRDAEGGLQSLLLFDPPAETWHARELALDTPGGEIAFEARAASAPRRLRVLAGDRELLAAALTPEWQPLRLAPPADVHRLRLLVDGCDEPAAEPGKPASRQDFSCHGFQLRGARAMRVELYDVVADPAQRHDLLRVRGREARRLLRELLGHRLLAAAAAGQAPLDPELAASLRALGYLQ